MDGYRKYNKYKEKLYKYSKYNNDDQKQYTVYSNNDVGGYNQYNNDVNSQYNTYNNNDDKIQYNTYKNYDKRPYTIYRDDVIKPHLYKTDEFQYNAPQKKRYRNNKYFERDYEYDNVSGYNRYNQVNDYRGRKRSKYVQNPNYTDQYKPR